MGLRELQAFTAVADTLHFGRAAERLGLSQPAVSQLVRRLERDLAVVLFERSTHHVALTTAGTTLLPRARAILGEVDALAEDARAVAAGTAGTLRIATTPGIGPSLNLLLSRFRMTHPGAEVDLQHLASGGKSLGLRSGAVDLAFVRAPMVDRGLRSELLWQEPMLAMVPADEAAEADAIATAESLAALPLLLVAREASPAMHDELLRQCRVAGIAPRLGTPLRGVQEAQALIAAGRGWMLVPAASAPRDVPGVVVRALPDPAPHTTVSLAWRADGLRPLAAAFVEAARESAAAGDLPQTLA